MMATKRERDCVWDEGRVIAKLQHACETLRRTEKLFSNEVLLFAAGFLGIHEGHCPTCSTRGCRGHLFSLLGRRQPDTGAPRQSDVSAGVLLPPLQCWQAHCKGVLKIHLSVLSHDMHYHGCHGYTLLGVVVYKSVSVCYINMHVLSY